MKNSPHRKYLAVLWIATLLAYSNSFQAGLIFDNASRIVEDTRLRAATAENIRLIFNSDYWHPWLGSGLYRPVTTLSYLFNYSVLGNGAQPFGYHLINWLLHSLNASLLYFLALRLLANRTAAVLVAAIWALHPVLTESITNVVGRADLLAGLAVLGGLLAYIRAGEGRNQWRWLALAAIASAGGMFSKESTVVAIAAAALYDLWARRKPLLAGYAALALPVLVYFVARSQVFANAVPRIVSFADNPLAGAPFLEAKLTTIRIIGKQMLLLLWPATLSPDYSYNQIPLSSVADWRAWLALAVCLALAAGAVVLWQRKHPAAFWIGFFFLTLAPTSNLLVLIGTPMAERLLYLPAIGFAGCLVAAAPRARTAFYVLGAIAIAFAARTYVRNFDWKDERSLWISAAAASPDSFKTHITLAAVFPEKALDETLAALAILEPVPDKDSYAPAFLNAGRLYREQGDRVKATAPGDAAGAYQRALAMLEQADRIRRAYDAAGRGTNTASNPSSWSPVSLATGAPLYQEFGRVYERLGRYDDAVAALRTAMRFKLAPDLFESLSVIYFRKGDIDRAAIALLEGVVADPKNSKLAGEIAALYRETGQADCALRTEGGNTGLNLECAMVHRQICTASANIVRLYRETGQGALADRTVQGVTSSLRCDPQLFRTDGQ